MDFSLLATKVRIPPQAHRALHRSGLIDALERGIPDHKLTLVSAAAGYGKTTLLAQWAHASRLPVGWLSLGEEDNDAGRFFRYLLAAWQEAQAGVMESPLGVLLGAMAPDSEAVLAAFINVASDLPQHTVFVLDDYHLIEEPSIHEALAFLLDHLPPTLHFVLAGRGEPPLPVARYRARHQMLELGARELRFSPQETADFLNERMGLDLTPDEAARLQAQLEGWVAGLQLAGLALRQRLTATDEPAVDGRQRFIADYLREDVLAPLAPGTRRFLLQTGILGRLCGPLCNAVSGQEDGQELLERLERENLFLLPLDHSRRWFRYHRLFADFLQEELQRRHADEVAALHRRAARWYLAHDLPEDAFRHALEGQDVELVLEIFERYAQIKLTGGEFSVLQRWLDALPEAWELDYPMISLVRTGLLLFTGRLNACLRCIEEVEQRLASVERNGALPQLARVSAVRCSIACFQSDLGRAEAFAGEAFQNLPEQDYLFRAMIYGSLGDTYRQHGRWQEARACYLEMLDFVDAPEFRVQSAHVFGALADLALRRGRLRDAGGYWRKALDAIQAPENWGRFPLPLSGWMYIRMAELHYEWNELQEARDHLSRGLERAELGGDVRAMIAGYLIAGRLKLTEGNGEAAAEYLERARPLVEDAQFADWSARFQRLQLECWLAQDKLRAAVHWCDDMAQNGGQRGAPDDVSQSDVSQSDVSQSDGPQSDVSQSDVAQSDGPQSDVAQLAIARVLIVKGDSSSLQQALTLLDRLLQRADTEGRTGLVLEALALKALGQWRCGDTAGAMTSLQRALRLAQPEGYVRLFADLGLPMVRLLQETHSRDVMGNYVEKVLAAFRGDLALPAPGQEALPEPLTDREQEVLELLAAGLTNREVAEQLVISPLTVKTHAGNIYGKLGVGSRTEAAARARELELLK